MNHIAHTLWEGEEVASAKKIEEGGSGELETVKGVVEALLRPRDLPGEEVRGTSGGRVRPHTKPSLLHSRGGGRSGGSSVR